MLQCNEPKHTLDPLANVFFLVNNTKSENNSHGVEKESN